MDPNIETLRGLVDSLRTFAKGADGGGWRQVCMDAAHRIDTALAALAAQPEAQVAGVEDLAEWMFNNQKDKLAAPWERQWEPTKAYWRGRAAERLATQPEAQAGGELVTVSRADLSDVLNFGVCFEACTPEEIEQTRRFDDAHDRLTAAMAAPEPKEKE